MRQDVEAVNNCCSCGVLHRDIKTGELISEHGHPGCDINQFWLRQPAEWCITPLVVCIIAVVWD